MAIEVPGITDSPIYGIFDNGYKMGLMMGRIAGAQEFLIFLGSRKFGPPDERARLYIQASCDRQELHELSTRIPEASSWSELLLGPMPSEAELGFARPSQDRTAPSTGPALAR